MSEIQSVDEIMYILRMDVEGYSGNGNDEVAIDAMFTKTKAALTRREERIKVEAQIDFIKSKSKMYGILRMEPTSKSLRDWIVELEQQLKALDGEE